MTAGAPSTHLLTVRARAGHPRPLLHRASFVAITVSITAQIVYPLVNGSVRDSATVVILCAGAAAMAADTVARRGMARATAIIGAISVIVFLAEVGGTRTGIPFGQYAYAQGRIGPSIAEVPVLITAAWFMGAYSVWRVAVYVAPRRPVLRVVAATVALVGWDLYLDPQMVAAGLWQWDTRDAGLPGIEQIPLTNYAGWAVLGLVVFTVLSVLDGRDAHTPTPDTPTADDVPLVAMTWFLWTWLGSAVAQLLFLEGGVLRPGIPYALTAMAVIGVPAVVKVTRCRR